MFSCPVSYHEDDSWGRKDGVFTIKLGDSINDLEKTLGNGQPVNFQIKNPDGELIKASKEEFGSWMKEGKNVKVPPKESLIHGVKGNIDSLTYFTESKSKDKAVKESYYEPRNEEDKKMIIERNRKKRELEKSQKTKKIEDEDLNELANREKSQTENSLIKDKKDQLTEKEISQQNLSQKLENKDSDSKNIYYGVGLISLVLLATGLVVVKIKKKK